MGRPPACIFVVRHGNRLDMTDKQWHLSSPTPYDTPLTYGGWQQAKMLGARIGAIVRERALEDEKVAGAEAATDGTASTKRKRRKYKIVLHSSPFLRCIQTSIAISAGLAQDPSPFEPCPAPPPSPDQVPGSRPTVLTNFSGTGASRQVRRSVLRLDAFLGEWMNPDYFELITPPPESVMMLASAKADLLRRENYQTYPGFGAETQSNPQGQLWGTQTSAKPTSPNGFVNLSGLASSLPGNGSGGGQSPLTPRLGSTSASPATDAPAPGSYVSPVPNYAISSGGTIPMGFVSHAKDACVDIDYQWDSMREPLDWGSGGTFGEEWANMHKRFRKGLQSLVDWYSTEENPSDMVTKMATRREAAEGAAAAEAQEEVETESIVVLVSHGAGCNAMIGAITHQPALTEVSMASLTMAVRKPGKDSSDAHDDDPFEHVTHDKLKGLVPLHRFYDMRMVGSTEHLRSATPTPSSTRSPAMASVFGGTRSRHSNSLSSALSNFTYSDASESRSSSANTALGNMRRSSGSTGARSTFGAGGATGGITVGSGRSSFTSTNAKPFGLGRNPSIGLWSPVTPPGDDEEGEEDDDMLLNFSHETEPKKTTGDAASPAPTTSSSKDTAGPGPLASAPNRAQEPGPTSSGYAEDPKQGSLQKLGMGAGGLWGASPPPTAMGETIHDMSSTKRRWTVNERA